MGDFIVESKYLYSAQITFLTNFTYLVKFSILLYMIGATNTKSKLLLKIIFFVKLPLGCFLVYRFTGYRTEKIRFTELDRKIAYSAGLYIIVISLADSIALVTEKTRREIIKNLKPFRNLLSYDYKVVL